MLGIINSDTRMYMTYQHLKKKTDCILLDDFSLLGLHLDGLVLPMSGLRDDDTMIVRGIEMKCSREFFGMLNEDGVLFCGNVTPKIRELPYKLIDLNNYESFIKANSKLTAEGVLFLLLDNTNRGLLDQHVDLIGFGHAGSAIYEILKRLNVKVRVIRRSVQENHPDFVTVDDYKSLKPYEVIINTSLTNIIDDLMIKKMDENLIINLVRSAVFNEVLLRQRYCRIVHAGPLPAMFSSASAADILEEVLLEYLYEK